MDGTDSGTRAGTDSGTDSRPLPPAPATACSHPAPCPAPASCDDGDVRGPAHLPQATPPAMPIFLNSSSIHSDDVYIAAMSREEATHQEEKMRVSLEELTTESAWSKRRIALLRHRLRSLAAPHPEPVLADALDGPAVCSADPFMPFTCHESGEGLATKQARGLHRRRLHGFSALFSQVRVGEPMSDVWP